MATLHVFFGPDPDSYNSVVDAMSKQDGSCRPGIAIVSSAIAFWANQQPAPPTAGEAARLFNMPLEAVRDAIQWHPFLDLLEADHGPLESRRIGIVGQI
ncbi:MAG: hypothetical protein AB7O57_18175 [Hyphomicrobiaceae bacterium]